MTFYVLPQPVYVPAMKAVSDITNGSPALVTTTSNHNYLDGTIVRLVIFPEYGMYQANQLVGTVTVNDATSFYIDIDTTYFDPFITPSSTPQTCQVIPIGETTEILSMATRNRLPY